MLIELVNIFVLSTVQLNAQNWRITQFIWFTWVQLFFWGVQQNNNNYYNYYKTKTFWTFFYIFLLSIYLHLFLFIFLLFILICCSRVCVSQAIFASCIPEIIDLIGTRPKYGGTLKNEKGRRWEQNKNKKQKRKKKNDNQPT